MGIINQQVCDGCGKIVYGRNGVETTKRSYVSFSGQITTHTVDDKTKWVDHRYLNQTDNHELSFCMKNGGLDLDCMAAYIDARTIIVNQKIEAAKRRQAGEELQNRDDDFGQDFTVGTKPYKKYGNNYKKEY